MESSRAAVHSLVLVTDVGKFDDQQSFIGSDGDFFKINDGELDAFLDEHLLLKGKGWILLIVKVKELVVSLDVDFQ